MKKMLQWYNILVEKGLLIWKEEAESTIEKQ
jgi:hypothetical protein